MQKKGYGLIIICLVTILIAGYFELSNYHRAFPEHAIDFQINRKESADIALAFLSRINVDVSSKIHAVAFDFDNSAKTFIEKEVGIEEAEDLLANDFRIWQWVNRWFEPLNREEIFVAITPNGKIARFQHKIPEEASAPLLSIDEARRLSHKFLNDNIDIKLGDWEFLEDKTEVKPNRVDYQFTYKKKNVEIYNATYRFDVTVQGDQIGQYKEYLHVPEEWQRNYQRLRSQNTTTATTADVLFILILLTIFIYFIVFLTRKQIDVRTALIFGIITFVLKFLSELNLLPLYLFHFDINQSMGAFYGNFFVSIFLQALLLAVVITVLTGAGAYIYTKRYNDRIPLARLFSTKGLQTRHFFFSIIAGITLAITFMAFQTFFYLFAKRFGAWAPANISYSDTLNTAFPWILILVGGFLPAVLEEFSFRLFAIPFLEKILKSKILAILIPAVIWGFAHANYPNQPFWIRGFEVSIFGIVIGFIFIKFGILTVLVWHYMVDAIYSSILLLRTGETYHVVSASIALSIILIPLIYNIIMYLKNKGFSDYHALLAPSIIEEKKPAEESEPTDICPVYVANYRQFATRQLRIVLILTVLLAAVQWIPYEKIGEFYTYPITRAEIKKTAVDFLKTKGVDPDNYKSALVLMNNYDKLNGQYILEYSSIKKLNSILARYLNNSVVWKVRFYQPLEKEEYNIFIHPSDRTIVGFSHLMPESAETFSLDKGAARFRAEEFLNGRGLSLTDFDIVEDYAKQLPKRMEYTFIWEAKKEHPANVRDATLRLQTIITGDDVSSYSVFYKIPEEWRHQKTRTTSFDSIRLGIQIAVLCLIAVLSIVLLTRRIKSLSIEWKKPLVVSVVIGSLWLIMELANYPIALINYNTSWGLPVWTIFWILVTLLRVLAVTLILFILTMIVSSVYPASLSTLKRDCRYHFSRDAIFAAILVTVGFFGIQHLTSWLASRYAPATIFPKFQIPPAANYILPTLHTLISITSRGIIYASGAGIAIFWINKTIRNQFFQIVAVAALLGIFIPDNYDSLREYAVLYASIGALIVWGWMAIKYFLRNNIPAYLYTGILLVTVSTVENLVSSGTYKAYVGALAILGIVTLLLIWLLTEKRDVNIIEWIKRSAKQIMINK